MSGRVYVSGMGVVSALGHGREAYWSALCAGRCAAAPVEGFDTGDLGRSIACEIKDFDPGQELLSDQERGRQGRCSELALVAARMAMRDAELVVGQVQPARMSVVLGTTMGEVDVISRVEQAWLHEGEEAFGRRDLLRYGTGLLPVHLARALGAGGILQALPAACAAGNYAIGFASDLIRTGRADVVVTGAAELIDKVQFSGFVRLGAVAPERCQPFDRDRQGLLLGEGAGLLVLESEGHLRSRGATPLAEVAGYGLACDGHHITRPHPEGEGSVRAIRAALRASGIGPEQVDHINAHGTGTGANDLVEAKVVREVFGDRRVPVTSLKGMLGHCMGAASALEAVACVETIQHGLYPPTVGLENQDPVCDIEVVAGAAREGRAEVVLNNSLAFGGYDAVVCFARPDLLPADGTGAAR